MLQCATVDFGRQWSTVALVSLILIGSLVYAHVERKNGERTGLAMRGSSPVPMFAKSMSLSSGFDSDAEAIYQKHMTSLWQRVLDGSIVQVSFPPLSWRAVEHGFWRNVNTRGWEVATYAHFNQFITKQTTLVDFGTWIGPTILYGAQLSKRAFGIEADPVAFAEVSMNVNLNSDKLGHIHIQPSCVSTEEKVMEMQSAAAGNSCSGLGKVACGDVTQRWSVQCYELQKLFRYWDVELDLNTFIKIDIESHECELIPHLKDWFAGVRAKPTLHIAMHSQIRYCSEDQYSSIDDLIHLYKYGYCHQPIESMMDYNAKEGCSSGDLVLSDFMPPM